MEITFAEMYSGLGGMRYGLEKTNIENNDSSHESQPQTENTERGCGLDSRRNKRKTSYRCVWANDIDKYACQIYRKNYGDKELVEGDIRTIDPKSIPHFDLLTAGFPCQSFSLAGKRRGFEDTRGTLFYEVARIAEAKRPKLLLLENVKGLLSNDKGRTFAKIIQTLDDLGCDVEWQVLNSKYFGVPQNRERVFIIGHSRAEPTRQIFPITNNGEKDCEVGEVAGTLQGGGHSGGLHSNMTAIEIIQIKRTHADGNDTIRTYQNETPTLTSQMGTGDGNVPLVSQALQTDGFLRSGSSFGTDKLQSSRNIRRFTPTECERLQGFPDGWTEKGFSVIGNEVTISDTQRYKTLGNAVTTNVIQFIGEHLSSLF